MDARKLRRKAPVYFVLAACLAAVSACAPSQPMVVAPFRLAPAEAGADADAPPAGRAERGSASAQTQGKAQLSVSFRALAEGARKLMATTAADVESIKIRLEGRSLTTEEDVAFVHTVDRAALEAGTRSHAFTGLPYAEYEVIIEAFDAAGTLVGMNNDMVAVFDDTPVAIEVRIQLAHGILPAPPLPSPAPTATPAPTPAEDGRIDLGFSLRDGFDLQALNEVAAFPLTPGAHASLELTPDGRLAVLTHDLPRNLDVLQLVAPADGATWSASYASGRNPIGAPRFGAGGQIYVGSGDAVRLLDAQGGLTTWWASPSVNEVAAAAGGGLWATSNAGLERRAPDGTAASSTGGSFSRPVAVAANGDAWVYRAPSLERYAPDGRLVATVADPLAYGEWLAGLQVGPDGSLWETRGMIDGTPSFRKFDPQGQRLGTFAFADTQDDRHLLRFDAAGDLLVLTHGDAISGPAQYVTRVSATSGAVLGRYYVGPMVRAMAVDRDHRIWTLSYDDDQLRCFVLP